MSRKFRDCGVALLERGQTVLRATLVILALFVAFAQTAQAQGGSSSGDKWKKAMRSYLKTPEAEADRNGLGEIVDALDKFNSEFAQKNEEQIDRILDQGWKGEDPVAREAIRSAAPSMQLIAAGCKKPFVRYPQWSKIAKTPAEVPMPNFLRTHSLAKSMALFGLSEEANGRQGNAMAVYLDILRFGGRMADENSGPIAKMIGMKIQEIGLDRLDPMLANQSLSPEQYGVLASEMERQRVDDPPLWKCFENDAASGRWFFEHAGEITPSSDQEKTALDRIKNEKEKLLQDYNRLWDGLLDEWKKPYPQWRKFDVQAYIAQAQVDPLIQSMIPSGFAPMRECVLKARMRLTAIGAAIQREKTTKGEWPASLDVLGLKNPEMLKDPFTEAGFAYRLQEGKPMLYSFGPDMDDDGGTRQINTRQPENADGDIVFRF